MNKISVVIITLNEEKNIERAILSAQKISDDIIVVDSFSTDNTKAICLKLKVNFIEKEWLGYGNQKNFAVSFSKHNWIFSLDADEEISDQLASSLLKQNLENTKTIFEINRLNFFQNKPVKFGLWGRDKVCRFYNKNSVQWDSNSVHENLVFSPNISIKKIEGKLHHYSFNSETELSDRLLKYATLSAQKMHAENKKNTVIKLYINPLFKFVVNYIFRLGFLDGINGFIIAKHISKETFLKYKLLKDLQTNQTKP